MLSELEEIIAYKQSADQPERQEVLRKTWRKRQLNFTCLHRLHYAYNVAVGYKVVSLMLRCGSEFYNFVPWFYVRKKSLPCGSNLLTCAAKMIECG